MCIRDRMCTHLAAFRTASNIRKQGFARVMKAPLGYFDANASGPVSYTHLDVYKRQILFFPFCDTNPSKLSTTSPAEQSAPHVIAVLEYFKFDRSTLPVRLAMFIVPKLSALLSCSLK